MNKTTRSNIYDYGSRRDETKRPDYDGHRRSRHRRRRPQGQIDTAARYLLYFLSAVAVMGIVAYAGMRWKAGKVATVVVPSEENRQK